MRFPELCVCVCVNVRAFVCILASISHLIRENTFEAKFMIARRVFISSFSFSVSFSSIFIVWGIFRVWKMKIVPVIRKVDQKSINSVRCNDDVRYVRPKYRNQRERLHTVQMISILYAFLWACQTLSEKQTTASNIPENKRLPEINPLCACVVFIASIAKCFSFFRVFFSVVRYSFQPLATCLPSEKRKCCHKQRVVLQTIWQLKIVFNFVYRFFFSLSRAPVSMLGFGKFQPDLH